MKDNVTWISEDSIGYLRSQLSPAEKFADILQNSMEEVDALVESGVNEPKLEEVFKSLEAAISHIRCKIDGARNGLLISTDSLVHGFREDDENASDYGGFHQQFKPAHIEEPPAMRLANVLRSLVMERVVDINHAAQSGNSPEVGRLGIMLSREVSDTIKQFTQG